MAEQNIFCPYCGFRNTADAKFCMGCGADITGRLPISGKVTERPQTETQFADPVTVPPTETVFTPNLTTPSNLPNAAMPSSSNATTNRQTPVISTNNVRFADSGERLIAFIVDMIFISLISLIVSFGTGLTRFSFTDYGSLYDSFAPAGIVETIVAFIYFSLLEAFNNGQTVGKIVFKLRTVDMTTFGRVNPGQAFIHVLGKSLSSLYGFILFFDVVIGSVGSKNNQVEKNQIRLTQRLAKTCVIKI